MLATACVAMPTIAKDSGPDQPLSKDFLTYLAELVEVDGKWVHPTELVQQEEKPLTDSLADSQAGQKKKVDSKAMNKENTKPTDNQEEDK